ncbi:MAG: PilN domain-containing protein, partial [Desulfuromonadales bacterium]|nr:PilN domain-containing protein [Desulfuromonadales bacterium]
GICGAAYMHIVGEVDDVQQQIDRKKSEIAQLQKVIKEVKNFEKRQKDLRAKLVVLEKLKTARVGPVYLLDELYRAMPDKIWLTKFKEGSGKAKISGIGSSEETVALFMGNLEASPFYEGVELKVIKQKVQNKIKFQQFDLTCKTLSGKPDKKGQKTKKK